MPSLLQALRVAQTPRIQLSWIWAGSCACQKILGELRSLLQACLWVENLGRRAAALNNVPSSSC